MKTKPKKPKVSKEKEYFDRAVRGEVTIRKLTEELEQAKQSAVLVKAAIAGEKEAMQECEELEAELERMKSVFQTAKHEETTARAAMKRFEQERNLLMEAVTGIRSTPCRFEDALDQAKALRDHATNYFALRNRIIVDCDRATPFEEVCEALTQIKIESESVRRSPPSQSVSEVEFLREVVKAFAERK